VTAHLKIEDEGEDEKEDDSPRPAGVKGFKACKRAKPMFTGVLCESKAYRATEVVRFEK